MQWVFIIPPNFCANRWGYESNRLYLQIACSFSANFDLATNVLDISKQ